MEDQRRNNARIKMVYLVHDCNRLSVEPRPLSRQHFEHNAAKAPDVCHGVVGLVLRTNNFGCRPEYGARDCPRIIPDLGLGTPESFDLTYAREFHQYIA